MRRSNTSGYHLLYAVVTMVIVAVIFIVLCLSSFAKIEIDGAVGNVEWMDSTVYPLFNKEKLSNNDVEYCNMRIILDKENNIVYISLCMTLSKMSDYLQSGSYVYINGKKIMRLTGENPLFESDNYSGTLALDHDDLTKTITGEIQLSIKNGFPDSINLGIKCIDSDGIASNYANTLIYPLKTVLTTSKASKTAKAQGKAKTSHKYYSRKYTTKKKTTTLKTALTSTSGITLEDEENDDVSTFSPKKQIIIAASIAAAVMIACAYAFNAAKNKKVGKSDNSDEADNNVKK